MSETPSQDSFEVLPNFALAEKMAKDVEDHIANAVVKAKWF